MKQSVVGKGILPFVSALWAFASKRILRLCLAAVVLASLFFLYRRWSAWTAGLAAIPHFSFYAVVSLIALVFVLFLLWALWVGPQWEVRRVEQALPDGLPPETRFNLENEARKNWAQILGGTVVIFGFFAGGANFAITQQDAERNRLLALESQLTERYAKAITQLGEPNIVIRLAGINALVRIASEVPKEKLPIAEVLAALVRERMAELAKTQKAADEAPFPADTQECLTALGLRLGLQGYALKMNNVELQRANLSGLKLQGAGFAGANLTRALLSAADLTKASFDGAELDHTLAIAAHCNGATFIAAKLTNANLFAADLSDADLLKADLRGADLNAAKLKGANLKGANLSTVKNLTSSQLDAAIIDEFTLVPASLETTKQAKLRKK